MQHKAALAGEEEELSRIRNELEITLQKYKEAQQAMLEIPTLRARVETLQSQVDAERKVCSYRFLLMFFSLYSSKVHRIWGPPVSLLIES